MSRFANPAFRSLVLHWDFTVQPFIERGSEKVMTWLSAHGVFAAGAGRSVDEALVDFAERMGGKGVVLRYEAKGSSKAEVESIQRMIKNLLPKLLEKEYLHLEYVESS